MNKPHISISSIIPPPAAAARRADLYNWASHRCSAGGNCVFVGADDAAVAWGVPVAGKFGLDGDVRSSVGPKV